MATESGAKKEKKRNIFVRMGSWFKAAALELRKVTWPKFGEVMKKLGVVLGVVAFFFVALIAFDIILTMGHSALTYNPDIASTPWWQFWPDFTPTP